MLPAGAPDLRVLHVSDLHMTPQATARQRWVSRLAALEPDLVINTGDNLAHVDAVPVRAAQPRPAAGRARGVRLGVERLLRARPSRTRSAISSTRPGWAATNKEQLPWRDLGRGFEELGWLDLTHRRTSLEIKGIRIGFRGTDDAHLNADRYAEVAGPVDRDGVRRRPRRHPRPLPPGDRRDGLRRPRPDPRRPHPRRPGLRPRSTARWSPTATSTPAGSRACPSTAPAGTRPGCTSRPGSAPPRTPRSGSPAHPKPPC